LWHTPDRRLEAVLDTLSRDRARVAVGAVLSFTARDERVGWPVECARQLITFVSVAPTSL